MPRTDQVLYFIDSEEDIPEQYRKKIEECTEKGDETTIGLSEICPGKRGNIFSEDGEIIQAFADEQEYYLGHGTGEQNVDSIFATGLKAKDPEKVRGYMDTLRGVDSTTVFLGEGNLSLFSAKKELLGNWPHQSYNNIIIISVPRDYILPLKSKVGTDLYEAFCVGNDIDGYNLRPEFIKGVYNAEAHSFIENDSFYKNLSEEYQQRLIQEVKQKYIMLYAERSCISPQRDTTVTLTDEDLEKITLEWYRVQLRELKEDRKRMEEIDFEGTLEDDWITCCSDTSATGFNEMSQNVKGLEEIEKGIQQGLEDERKEL